MMGVGVASVFVSGFITSFLIRWAARRECLRILPPRQSKIVGTGVWSFLKVLWPNSWRVGLQLSGYLAVNVNGLICLHFFGLSTNAHAACRSRSPPFSRACRPYGHP